jgi:mRNA-degrading endonuclease RelE of RelBE toxin-antitoxin system
MRESSTTTNNTDQRRGYHVLINPKVTNDLNLIDTTSRTEIIDALKLIKYVKRPFKGDRLIAQSEYYRHTIGKYVVLYKFSEDGKAMVIIKITQRKNKGFEDLFY